MKRSPKDHALSLSYHADIERCEWLSVRPLVYIEPWNMQEAEERHAPVHAGAMQKCSAMLQK